MKKPMLIASTTFDKHAWGPVSAGLQASGYPVIVYRTDRLLAGQDVLVIDMRSDTPLLSYNGMSIAPGDLSAAWSRKIASFALADADTQLAKQLYMNNEVRALHDSIWPVFYPNELWLSAPTSLAAADRKLSQLMVARSIGFTVPETLVASSWTEITEKLASNDEAEFIVKMMRGVIAEDGDLRAMPTTILNRDRACRLSAYTSPFPGLYQPYVRKRREWRVTVVGHHLFPVAIYTDESAKDDWRKHQNRGTAVRFEAAALPDGIAELCLAYLKEFDLGYGAFDLIETPEGEVVFLECNPNGQYGWLEEDLGLPITEAIIEMLILIAQSRGC